MYIVLHIQLSVLKSNHSYMCNEDLKFGLCKRVCYIRVTDNKIQSIFKFNFNKGDGAVLAHSICLLFLGGGGGCSGGNNFEKYFTCPSSRISLLH